MINYLIYDCEIINLIPPKGDRLPNYNYCEGWDDHKAMGVSVVGLGYPDRQGDGVWDSRFMTIPTLQHWLSQPGHIIGFNSRKFDDKLMAANGVKVKTTYDLLDEILLAAGQAGKAYWKNGLSYSLGKIGEANGHSKTGSGELAPVLWQDGKFDEVRDYCINDIKVTHELLRLGWAGGLIDPNTGDKLQLRKLEDLPPF